MTIEKLQRFLPKDSKIIIKAMGYLFIPMIATLFVPLIMANLLALIASAFTNYTVENIRIVILEYIVSYVPLTSLTAGFAGISYFTWKVHAHSSKITAYVLIALGGAFVILGPATINHNYYGTRPDEYYLDSNQRDFFSRYENIYVKYLVERNLLLTRAAFSINRIIDAEKNLPGKIRYIDGLPTEKKCSRLDLAQNTGSVCVTFTVMTGPRQIVTSASIYADSPGLARAKTSLDITSMVNRSKFYCAMEQVLSNGKSIRDNIDRYALISCFKIALLGAYAEERENVNKISLLSRYPSIPYRYFLLESIASRVGNGYKAANPISDTAIAISVVSSVWAFLYFVLFAAIILDAVGKRKISHLPFQWDDPVV